MKFTIYRQHDSKDCGATCLRIICKYHGKSYSPHTLRELTGITKEGVSILGISNASEKLGFRPISVKTNLDELKKETVTPFIAHWQQQHFVVVYRFHKEKVYVADPAEGKVTYSERDFLKYWANNEDDKNHKGIVLLLDPTPEFFSQEDEKLDKSKLSYLFRYLTPYKKLIGQLLLSLLIGSVIQLIFPFLTQSLVDVGIANNSLNFIYIVLIAQMVLFISRMIADFIRSWIMLHISTRINISLISDFLFKLMKLPIGFFDSKMTGDLMKRIDDHQRIEHFLTGQTLNTLFSMVNLLVFAVILAYYSLNIFIVFLIGSILYVTWIFLFMKKRRELNFKEFQEASVEQSRLIEIIHGMQEIKLHNAERQKRWNWESIQARLFRISIKGLVLQQYQQLGTVFINESKNIVITFFAAYSVIQGDITLGVMLAIQYIIGQLDVPINQFINFIHSFQDAKISLERLGEIHQKDDEENIEDYRISLLPQDKSISMVDIRFKYDLYGEDVLKGITLHIPQNKITAIVGTSGSGKTTLVKLLLGFYRENSGEIKVGENKHARFSQEFWRSQVGAVMQDGYIFNDTIAQNIAVGHVNIDKVKLVEAVDIANIREFIERLPLGYNTKIGNEGHGLSQGQKQRILIARAVYKNPQYLFFDEATNALDANNEKKIMENLNSFFVGRTVIVVAHRLSTVKNADQIVVINDGKISEKGTHRELTNKKGEYYDLVKNQLELGS